MKKGVLTSRATVIGVVGGKKSGKTTTIEVLTRELSRRGYKVAAAKHIPETGFTMDSEGKDTWRYAQSGAKVIIAASANEIATLEKAKGNLSLEDILQRCGDSDVVLLEGFRKLLTHDKTIYKIVVAKSPRDIEEADKVFEPILAFTGPYAPENTSMKTPYIDVIKHSGEMADLLEKAVEKKL